MSDGPSPAERTGQSVPRRHHYIPQMVQRRFAGSDGQLWSFDKRHPERGVERRPIKRLFQVRHLYTIRRRDGTRDTTTETRLSAIESRAGPVLERVIKDARAGRLTTFSQADQRALVDLLIAQHRRSPDLHRGVLIRRSVDSIIADGMAQWEALHGSPSAEERAFLASPKFIERARRDAMAEGAASPLETATPAMLQRGFAVARITAPRRAFILGSTPFARFMAMGTRRQDLGDPGAELWMPVAWDVAICSVGRAGYSAFIDADDPRIRKMNRAVVGSSTVFASASRDLVEAYARTAKRGLRIRGGWEEP
ncbi:DUF4238 domain-containing protein [Methylobacterium sp. E-041]|uniref:DUF4238 domain-containing protein n=1 Tax=Methylobacterium sp. E-041 TaxID=2836573 RepID=UPI001FBBEE60|nr:DUF4238 domain-containing protein [Methylobacterium sp. E-041]MCJ2108256.1 DUF4238 domain-containing protein [Methylobacterium sp. E-041]